MLKLQQENHQEVQHNRRYDIFTQECRDFRDQMQQLDDIFKVMLDVQKEYNSLLPAEEQEGDEEWFDEVDHNICIFKQKSIVG